MKCFKFFNSIFSTKNFDFDIKVNYMELYKYHNKIKNIMSSKNYDSCRCECIISGAFLNLTLSKVSQRASSLLFKFKSTPY